MMCGGEQPIRRPRKAIPGPSPREEDNAALAEIGPASARRNDSRLIAPADFCRRPPNPKVRAHVER
jgi:hypothetical protein